MQDKEIARKQALADIAETFRVAAIPRWYIIPPKPHTTNVPGRLRGRK